MWPNDRCVQEICIVPAAGGLRVQILSLLWLPLPLLGHVWGSWVFRTAQKIEHSKGDSVVKNLLANAGDLGSVPGPGRSPGKRNGNPLQYSCLGNPTDRGTWQATVHGITKESDTTEVT